MIRALTARAHPAPSSSLGAGGTLDGNVTITGDLTVQGTTTSTVNQTVSGTVTVTAADANALTVGRQGATDPVLKIDSATASQVTGMSITGAAAGGRVAVAAISSGADEGISINGKGSGNLLLQNSGTGKVGIGNGLTSPTGMLHVRAGSSGATANAFADDFVLEHSTTGGISVLVPDASSAVMYWGSPSDNSGAQITWNHNSNLFQIGTAKANGFVRFDSDNSVEGMRLTAASLLGVGTSTPSDKVHINVGTTGAVECMQLQQQDDSEGFVNFVATSAASAANPLTSWTTGNAAQGHLRVEINGTDRWIRFYDAPTS